jgi:hypothetical protein
MTPTCVQAHVGKVAYIAEDINYCFGGFMAVLRAQEGMESRFLFYLLIGKTFSDYLQSAESAMPGYVPSGTPTSSQVQSAISTANADINSAVSTTNGYIAQANAYVATAYGYTATAYKVGSCGSPPSLPTPVPTISASEASSS